MPKINREEYETLKGLHETWEWIAVDGDNYVWGYENRPKKLEGTPTWDDLKTSCYAFLGAELFQFIQWEDEEPHNIQELIEEYESSPSNPPLDT